VKTLRINGVYNTSIINEFLPLGINQFAFDLRPRSFNFIQAYEIARIIHESSSFLQYVLLFENEKDFVIIGLLEQLENLSGKNDFILQYNGQETFEEIQKIKKPYYWVYHSEESFRKFCNDKNCKRIIFSSSELTRLTENNEIYPIIQEIQSLDRDDLEIEFSMEWACSLPKSLIDFFQIKLMCFEVSPEVEAGYRQADLNVIKKHLTLSARTLNEFTSF
jgi:hypothetical protein